MFCRKGIGGKVSLQEVEKIIELSDNTLLRMQAKGFLKCHAHAKRLEEAVEKYIAQQEQLGYRIPLELSKALSEWRRAMGEK